MKMITEYKQGMRIYLYRKMGGGANGVIPEMDRILDELFHKADSLDRTAEHIESERWNLAEDLIGEDDEDVRRQILIELAVLQRIKDVMEVDHDLA